MQINIPEASRIRDLRAGNKVVIDVYHPASGPVPQTAFSVQGNATPLAQTDPPKPEPESEEPSAQEPEQSASDNAVDKAIEQQQASEAAPEISDEGEGETSETVQLEMREEPTLITVSSTKNFGMAAFELGDQLWIVNDKSDILVRPQASGPQADELEVLSEQMGRGDVGRAYVFPRLANQKIIGREGGVLWRLFIGNELTPKNQEPSTPIRTDVERDEMRSGRLLWPIKGARAVLSFEDPRTGREIQIVTVRDADQYAGPAREFIDFEVLPSPVGLAIIPKVSDLKIQIVRGGVEISRPSGLTLVEQTLLNSMTPAKSTTGDTSKSASATPRIFDFKAWQLGGVDAAPENRRVILGGLKNLSKNERAENLLTLGKMYIANGMGAEALGALNFAKVDRPSLNDSAEFNALFGVASALAHHNEDAIIALTRDDLKGFEEIDFWRAFILADEADWQQATKVLPANLAPLLDYPALLQNRLLPGLAEIALRAGDLDRAERLLSVVEENKKTLLGPQMAELDYLKGEAARQQNETDTTVELWQPLTKGADDLYRAKAGLALTRLQFENGDITTKQAIDNLEHLRYAWRGDQLEVQINYWLGRTYFEAGEYLKGLKIMRDAVSYDEGTPLGQRVAGEMADLYSGLFLSDKLDQVSPLDAIGLYDEFKELVPLDNRGDQIVERMAEHLADADLLTRAGDLLQYQLDHRLTGADVYRIAMRVAAIRLLDNMPDKAMAALDKATASLGTLPEEMRTPDRYRNISLLRARALSRKGRPDQALALLNDLNRTPEMNLLRADIAWTAGYWDDAAEALEDVILDKNISLTRPLEEEDKAVLLQRAVSLNLAGDRIALANMREKYSDLMNQTDRAKVFEVITRPRQRGELADRDTLLSVVSEVDLFKEFLDAYKTIE